jgi:hypothetical protein
MLSTREIHKSKNENSEILLSSQEHDAQREGYRVKRKPNYTYAVIFPIPVEGSGRSILESIQAGSEKSWR